MDIKLTTIRVNGQLRVLGKNQAMRVLLGITGDSTVRGVSEGTNVVSIAKTIPRAQGKGIVGDALIRLRRG